MTDQLYTIAYRSAYTNTTGRYNWALTYEQAHQQALQMNMQDANVFHWIEPVQGESTTTPPHEEK